MPLEDRLKQLRREREARAGRPRSVENAWEKIDAEAGLTVKEKLESLISLTDKGRGLAPAAAPRAVPAKRREPVQVFENSYLVGASYQENRGTPPLFLRDTPGSVTGKAIRHPYRINGGVLSFFHPKIHSTLL